MNPCIFIVCTMKNIYILTEALEVLHVLVYIDSLHALEAFYVPHALEVLHVLVYIDSLHVLELFVYINLPLLRHSMYSRRLFNAIRPPIDRHTYKQCPAYILVFHARVRSIYSSSSMYSISTVFAFKNLFHVYLAFFEFFAATRVICVYPIAQGSAPPIHVYMQTLCCVPPGCESDLAM